MCMTNCLRWHSRGLWENAVSLAANCNHSFLRYAAFHQAVRYTQFGTTGLMTEMSMLVRGRSVFSVGGLSKRCSRPTGFSGVPAPPLIKRVAVAAHAVTFLDILPSILTSTLRGVKHMQLSHMFDFENRGIRRTFWHTNVDRERFPYSMDHSDAGTLERRMPETSYN